MSLHRKIDWTSAMRDMRADRAKPVPGFLASRPLLLVAHISNVRSSAGRTRGDRALDLDQAPGEGIENGHGQSSHGQARETRLHAVANNTIIGAPTPSHQAWLFTATLAPLVKSAKQSKPERLSLRRHCPRH